MTFSSDVYTGHSLTLHPPDPGEVWGSDHSIFRKLISELKPQTIFEIGSWKGASAIRMCQEAIRAGCDMSKFKLYCIDTWLGSAEHRKREDWVHSLRLKNGYPQLYQTFLSNVIVSGMQEYIVPVPLPSSIAAELLREVVPRPSLIYLDGSHDYDSVYRDLDDYWGLLASPGALLIDDYGDANWLGFERAVDDFLEAVPMFTSLHRDGTKAWIYKP